MPTEKIQRFCRQREYGKNSDVENGFRLPATLNLSTACHDGVGLGECKKREKERFVFERFFVGTERRKPFFALLLIYTAKNGKTWQKNCLFYKKFIKHILQQAKITGLQETYASYSPVIIEFYLPPAFSICIRRFCFTLNARTKTIQNAER